MTLVADHMFGIRSEDNHIYIRSKPVTFDGGDICAKLMRYKGTTSLWKLIVKKCTDPETYDAEDLENYAEIQINTKTMYQNSYAPSQIPKANKSYNCNCVNVIKPISTGET